MDTGLLDRCARARFHLPGDAVLVGVTALQVRGVDVGPHEPVRPATLTRAQTRRQGVRLSRLTSLPPHVDGVALPAAAWCQAARDLDLVELVAAGDALLEAGLVTLPDLQRAASRATGRGCRLATRS